MRRLLSDVDGRIKHVLLCLSDPGDIRRVASIVRAFDEDVEVTIACHQDFGTQLPRQPLVAIKRLLRRNLSASERLAIDLPGRRKFNLLPVEGDPWIWAQDLIHVLDDKVLSPSIPEAEKALSGIGKLSQLTSSQLLKHRFWRDRGFEVAAAMTPTLSNSDGGDLIACGETLFVGGAMIGAHLKYKVGHSSKYVKRANYKMAESRVLHEIKHLDDARTLCVLPFQADHLDMVFTPVAENCLVLADINGPMEGLRLPANVSVQERYNRYAGAVENLAQAVSEKCSGAKVVRVPCVPPLVCEGQVLNHFTSYNNILQEKFRTPGGDLRHRVYVPVYSHAPALLRYINPANWFNIMNCAVDVYRSIGLEVRTVPFLLEPSKHIGGGLRCSVKVLEREF